MGIEFQEMLESYGIKSKLTTVKNPTANTIIERIHGMLGEQLQATIFDADCSNNLNTLIQHVHLHFVQHHRLKAHTCRHS